MRGYDATRIFVLLGDQELNEGQVWEAAQAASHFGLGNLVAIVDRNRMGLDGATEEVMPVEPIAERFRAFGWRAEELATGTTRRRCSACLRGLPAADSERAARASSRTRSRARASRYMERSRTWHLGYLAPEDERATTLEIADDG